MTITREVIALAAEGRVEYEVRADDSKLKKDMDQAEKTIKQGSKGAEEAISNSAKGAEKDIDNVSAKSSKMGSIVSAAGGLAATGFLAIGSAAVGAGVSAVNSAVSLDQAMNQFATSTGVGQAGLDEYEENLKNIYANNYGDSFEDVGAAMGQ